MNSKGVNGLYFYLGGEGDKDYKYGLTNVAAFLAQSMKETIKYDACDEVSQSGKFLFKGILINMHWNTLLSVVCTSEFMGSCRWKVSTVKCMWSAASELSRLPLPRP